jgi:hypothetical protein
VVPADHLVEAVADRREEALVGGLNGAVEAELDDAIEARMAVNCPAASAWAFFCAVMSTQNFTTRTGRACSSSTGL